MLVCICVLVFVGNAFAWDRIFSSYWSDNPGDKGKDSSYAPNSGDVYSYHDLGSTDRIKIQVEDARYDSSSISAIANYYYNNNWRHGLDVTDMTDRLDYNGFWYTNYPDPKFDIDDDDFDGKNEETEVTCQRVLSMSAGTPYDFYVEFYNYYNPAGSSGYLEVNSHESEYSSFFDEYQTQAYDYLTSIYYDTFE